MSPAALPPAATAAVTDAAPRLRRGTGGAQGAPWALSGRWTAAAFADRAAWSALSAALRGASADDAWDLRGAAQFDHIGAQLLWERWQHRLPAALEASDGQRAILQQVAEFAPGADAQAAVPAQGAGGIRTAIDHLGTRVLDALGHIRDLVALVGQLVLDLVRVVRAPRMAPWRDVSGHLYQMGATAMPITALVGFLIGIVLAYLMGLQLQQFGANSFIVNILGISLIRELGPLLAAILVAGRSGSAITAQIGVMQVTEEIDAMRVMGIPEGFRLVMPRALALAVAMPLIALWTTLASLAGGMLAADVSIGITPGYFLSALPQAVAPANLGIAMLKSLVFGVMIALIGSHFGLRVKPNTESLGQGTTASVVTSITVVILVDAVFAIVFRNVGI